MQYFLSFLKAMFSLINIFVSHMYSSKDLEGFPNLGAIFPINFFFNFLNFLKFFDGFLEVLSL